MKVWVQAGGHRGEMFEDTGRRWEKAMDDMIKHLVKVGEHPPKGKRRVTYLADVRGVLDLEKGYVVHKFNHLSCFVPGMLALGVHKGKELLSSVKQRKYLKVAEELTETCYEMCVLCPFHSSPHPALSPFRRLFHLANGVREPEKTREKRPHDG